MLLNWVLIFNALTRHPPVNRRNAFDDPLERGEWRGCDRANRFLSFLIRRF